ncbi:hypothetical protein J6590_103515 [Homalodisca vitripennis]|nr:hypothetical protein J6590_062642 [Homalodisca vitripennis]KAG8313942.1 hypothetical protein J6590_103515 [Homalodisca vitripennis]
MSGVPDPLDSLAGYVLASPVLKVSAHATKLRAHFRSSTNRKLRMWSKPSPVSSFGDSLQSVFLGIPGVFVVGNTQA